MGAGASAYRAAISELVELGCRVYTPALPGFGGTPGLPRPRFSLAGYARWVDAFVEAIGVTEPLFVVGHSFGGGVGIKFAHDFGDRVRSLVLVNSIGGAAWTDGEDGRAMVDRSLWRWGLGFPNDVWPIPQATKVVPVVLQDAVGNLVRNPKAMWRVSQLVRRADLTRELRHLAERKMPVVVIWGERDGVIPRASFDAMCEAVGTEGEVVQGSHSWLMADPVAFAKAITAHVAEAMRARSDLYSRIDQPLMAAGPRRGPAIRRSPRRRVIPGRRGGPQRHGPFAARRRGLPGLRRR